MENFMKLALNIEESLKNCPPTKNPAYLRLPDDIRSQCVFLGRKILPTKQVDYSVENQTRVLKVKQDKVGEIRSSFEVSGFVHTEYPPAIKPSERKNFYVGLVGHTRNQVFSELDVSHMMYDMWGFTSPLAERLFNGCHNQVFTPREPHSKQDIIFQILEAIEKNEIPNTDVAIRDMIKILAADKTEKERKTIFKKVRENKSKFSHIATYHSGEGTNSTSEFAKKYNVPYKREANYESTGKLGYIPPYSKPVTNVYNSKMQMTDENNLLDYYFTFYVSNPTPGTLKQKRKVILQEFNDMLLHEATFIKLIMDKIGVDVDKDKILNALPWHYSGFLAQDMQPIPEKYGRMKEEGVVDVDGNPYQF